MNKLKLLIDFYRKLDESLKNPDGSVNFCGTCKRCCTGFHLFLTRLEYELIVENLQEKRIHVKTKFPPAIIAKQGMEPEDPSLVCPMYREEKGCLVYEVRPLPCRLYGNYIREGTFHFDECVYKNPVPYKSIEEIPHWEEYARILRLYPSPTGYLLIEEGSTGLVQ